MKSLLKTVKKRKNKRRLSAFWLFLVVIELFCPVMCDDQAFAADPPSLSAEVRFSNNIECDSSETVEQSENQNQDQNQTFCSGDCLCHGTAIPGFPFSFEKAAFSRSEQVAFQTSDPIFKSLPPPFRPPKFS